MLLHCSVFIVQIGQKMRVYVFCWTDFSQYPSEVEDCFSAAAFDVLENAANVSANEICVCVSQSQRRLRELRCCRC